MKYRTLVSAVSALLVVAVSVSTAATRKELEAMSRDALDFLFEKSPGARELATNSHGILVFPRVVKAGVLVGGEYGEGVLFEGKTPERYYSIVSGSLGFQVGAQVKSQVVLFMTEDAYVDFRESEGWKAGVDGSIALAMFGLGGAVDRETANEPIIGFIFGNKGLMYSLSFEGSKISRIKREERRIEHVRR